MKIKSDKQKNIFLLIALIHFALSFLFDGLIFKFNILSALNTQFFYATIFWKLISLILYIVLWQLIGKLVSKIRMRDEKTLRILKYFMIYFGINIVILILTWPGVWRYDEFKILLYTSFYDIEFWQNYITSILYILSYMLIPLPSGVIIIQMIIASSIVAYVIYNMSLIFNKSKLVYLLYIPFLLLPVLDHNLYPLRSSLYAYFELLLICQLVFMKKLKKFDKKDFIILGIILMIITSWRSEGKIFLMLIPLIFLFIFKTELPEVRKRLLYTILVLGASILLILPQDYAYKRINFNRYDITSYINQLYVVIKDELKTNPESEELKEIEKVIDIEKLLQYEKGVWGNNDGVIYKAGATTEDYARLKVIYRKLLMKYPTDVIKERIDTFLTTSGFVSDYNIHVRDTRRIFDENFDKRDDAYVINFMTQYRQHNKTN